MQYHIKLMNLSWCHAPVDRRYIKMLTDRSYTPCGGYETREEVDAAVARLHAVGYPHARAVEGVCDQKEQDDEQG